MKIGVFLKIAMMFSFYGSLSLHAQEKILKGEESPNDTLWTRPEGTSFLHFTPDGKYLITSGANNTALFRNVMTGEVERTLEGISYIDDFSPDNKTIALTPNNQGVELRNYHDNSLIRMLKDSVPFPGSGGCYFTFNGQRVVHVASSGGSQCFIYCFNTETGELL
jgi:WD40 repeat protein